MNPAVIIWRAFWTPTPKPRERWVHRQHEQEVVEIIGVRDKVIRFLCPDGAVRVRVEAEFVCFWRPLPPTTTKGEEPK